MKSVDSECFLSGSVCECHPYGRVWESIEPSSESGWVLNPWPSIYIYVCTYIITHWAPKHAGISLFNAGLLYSSCLRRAQGLTCTLTCKGSQCWSICFVHEAAIDVFPVYVYYISQMGLFLWSLTSYPLMSYCKCPLTPRPSSQFGFYCHLEK